MARGVRLRGFDWVVGVVVATAPFGCSGRVENTGGGGPSPEQLIDQYCAKVVAAIECSQFSSQEDCQAQGADARAEAIADGCVAEFDNVLRCAANADLSCTFDVETTCAAQVEQFRACGGAGGGQECLVGIGLDPNVPACNASCGELAMECWRTSPDEPLSCTCTSGPATGSTFAASECSSDLVLGLCS